MSSLGCHAICNIVKYLNKLETIISRMEKYWEVI